MIHITLWMNYQFGGRDVLGYHVVNFLVHLAAGWILFGLVRRTLRLPGLPERSEASANLFAFAVAAIWMVHPLQTQAVTYIIQRCESMMAMFFLLTLYCVLRGSQSDRRWPWYVAAWRRAGWGWAAKR